MGETGRGLPAESTTFVGRERDQDEVGQLLAATRCVTLAGPGGIGKSRLALRAAARLAAEFPDGVCFAELADLDAADAACAAQIAGRVAAPAAVAEEPGRALDETLTAALRDRRLLVVLDNCEHVIAGCARLVDRLLSACPGVTVLATSREPLRITAETVWRVPPMMLPPHDTGDVTRHEAVRLFVERAVTARPDFRLTEANEAAVVRLCRELDGMPLAIELAAARVRLLSAEQIATRLGDRFRLLTSGDRAAPQRQRTLRATMDWSHELLAEPERVLLRRVTVFAGGWTLPMAEQVCGDELLPEADVLDQLAGLVEKSLVTVVGEVGGEVRYRMLETIREYALGRRAAAGEDDTLARRHLMLMADFAREGERAGLGRDPAPWDEVRVLLARVGIEYDNVRAALGYALGAVDAETGLRICRAMGRGWWIPKGELTEGARWYDRFLALDPDGTSAATRGQALIGRAEIAFEQHDHPAARAGAQAGLDRCRPAADRPRIAAALNLLAALDLREGRIDQASPRAGEAIDVARAEHDPWNETLALGTHAVVALAESDLRRARHRFDAALRLARAIDNPWGVGRILLGLGALARARGEQAEARRVLGEALALLRSVDARVEVARCLLSLGRLLTDADDLDAARAALREALTLNDAAGQRLAVARVLEACAELEMRSRCPREAVLLSGAAARLREDAGAPPLSGARRHTLFDRVTEELGAAVVTGSWEQGRQTSRPAAVALAMAGQTHDIEPPDPSADVPASREVAPRGAVAGRGGPSGRLTDREREIVALVARGLTNRAIADVLVISPATVARHVANILTKLGFGSRAQVAVWAVENGIAPGGAPAT